MARPAADYKILNDNRSSYNLIAHDHHVPQSPLFGPSMHQQPADSRRMYGDNRGGDRDEPRDYTRENAEKKWEELQAQETARARRSNRSPVEYHHPLETIRHEKHVPASPLYRPGDESARVDPRFGSAHLGARQNQSQSTSLMKTFEGPKSSAEDETLIIPQIPQKDHIPISPLYTRGHTPKVETDPRYGRAPGWREHEAWKNTKGQSLMTDAKLTSDSYRNLKGIASYGKSIGNINHLPVSPLYRPGQGQGLNMADPRYGSPSGPRPWGFRESNEDEELVPRPKDPPTPDYNTTQLQIPDNRDDDTKLQLGNMRGSQEDLRDYRQNNASWAGYQDRPAPFSDRPGYLEERSYRANPWTQRCRGQGEVIDPRIGGNPDGGGMLGARNGGALLFIRFPIGQGENVQVAAQAFLKSKTHDNGGRFVGLAKRVYDFGYERGPTEAVGVYHFPTMDRAQLFFQMDTIIRQPDFPPPYGHAEMWIVSNAYLPDNLKLFDTFLLSEVQLHQGKDKRDFFERFQKPFESYLYKNGAMPFVICSYGSYDRKSLRRHSYPASAIVTCHLFQGLDHLNWITNDETYSKFRSLHNQLATEKCSIFTLSRDMFP